MSEPITAYPLVWPTGWKRTASPIKNWRFKGHTIATTTSELLRELKLFGIGDWNVIISSNVALRKDGLPYSNVKSPSDTGVAVYFKRECVQQCFACDKWNDVAHNLHCIVRTVAALRQIERDGSSDLLDRAFTGFAALPPPIIMPHWSEVLGLSIHTHETIVSARYRELSKLHHPDVGGSSEKMAEINRAYEEFKAERL